MAQGVQQDDSEGKSVRIKPGDSDFTPQDSHSKQNE